MRRLEPAGRRFVIEVERSAATLDVLQQNSR